VADVIRVSGTDRRREFAKVVVRDHDSPSASSSVFREQS
jgi:hypothetical protein